MDNKIKHLELVQNIVNRMASNSFALKGWAVTLVSGVYALAGNKMPCFLVACVPVVMFWFLDAYYLLQERLYRSLYEKVQNTDEGNIDFSLDVTSREFDSRKNCFCSCLFSKTEAGYYLSLMVCSGIIYVFTHIVW